MTTEPKIPPLPEPFGYAREWEGDVSDWNNWLFETDKNELDDRPWVHLYSNEQVAVRDKQWAERVAGLEREKEAMLKDRVALAVRVEELERVLGVARDAMGKMASVRLGQRETGYPPSGADKKITAAIATIDAARSKEGGGA